MFCKECGSKIPEGSLFCTECGTPVNNGYTENTGASVTEAIQMPCPAPKPKKKSRKGLLVIVVLLCVILLGGGIAVMVISNVPERIQEVYDKMMGNRTGQEDIQEETETEQEQSSETSVETQQSNETVLFEDTQQTEENGQAEVEQNTELLEAEEQSTTDAASSGEVVLFRGDNYDENYEERIKDGKYEDEDEETVSGQEDYLLPDSDKRVISKKELEGFDAEQCRIARNEIYARHGRKFNDKELQEYFDDCDWYEGTIEADKFQDSVLNDYEVAKPDAFI